MQLFLPYLMWEPGAKPVLGTENQVIMLSHMPRFSLTETYTGQENGWRRLKMNFLRKTSGN